MGNPNAAPTLADNMIRPIPPEHIESAPTMVPETKKKGLTVSVFACGGAAINLADALMRSAPQPMIDTVRAFDTSDDANFVPTMINKIIASGEGGGHVRSTNVDPIKRALDTISEEDLPINDVSIVIFSLAGATGSTLGPMMVRKIAEKGGRVVAAVLADISSEITTSNSRGGLKSLLRIARDNEIYLPTILRQNSAKGGTSHCAQTDRELVSQVYHLIELLTAPTREVDRNDRRNWLNANVTVGATTGVKLLGVAAGINGTTSDLPDIFTDKTAIFESVLSLALEGTDGTQTFIRDVGQQARFRKEGILENPARYPLMGMISNDGAPINQLLSNIEAAATKFKSQSKEMKLQINLDEDDVDDSGLVI